MRPYLISSTDDTGGFVGIDFATRGTVQTAAGVVEVTFPAGATNRERLAIIAATDPEPVDPPAPTDEPAAGEGEAVPE